MRHVLCRINGICQPFPHRSTDRHVSSLPNSGECGVNLGGHWDGEPNLLGGGGKFGFHCTIVHQP
jgi:hypothetical protein